MSLFSI